MNKNQIAETVTKSALNLIPGVGGAIASILGDYLSIRKEARLNEFIKNADVVKIACYSSTVNATQGSITTDKYNAYMQGNGYALKLYSENMLDYHQPITFQRSKLQNEVFEVIGTTDIYQDKIAIAVVNSGDKKIRLTNENFGTIESRKYVTAESLEDYDNDENRKFKYYEQQNPTSLVVEPRSITTFIVHVK